MPRGAGGEAPGGGDHRVETAEEITPLVYYASLAELDVIKWGEYGRCSVWRRCLMASHQASMPAGRGLIMTRRRVAKRQATSIALIICA
jgi:hypothetical protein